MTELCFTGPNLEQRLSYEATRPSIYGATSSLDQRRNLDPAPEGWGEDRRRQSQVVATESVDKERAARPSILAPCSLRCSPMSRHNARSR